MISCQKLGAMGVSMKDMNGLDLLLADRVMNGMATGTVVGFMSDDFVSVVYDEPVYEDEPEWVARTDLKRCDGSASRIAPPPNG